MSPIRNEYQVECQYYTASVALDAANSMPYSNRIMIYRGILPLLPDGTEAKAHALAVVSSMEQSDKEQMRLIEIIQNS